MRRLPRWVGRLFTHPYGACEVGGCDKPRRRWCNQCDSHIAVAVREAARARVDREFNYQAEIVAEGIRRARVQP